MSNVEEAVRTWELFRMGAIGELENIPAGHDRADQRGDEVTSTPVAIERAPRHERRA